MGTGPGRGSPVARGQFREHLRGSDAGLGQRAGLAAQLCASLGRAVDTLAINDNGSYAPRGALASGIHRGRDRLAGKKVVVYAFASRELAFGDWRTGYRFDER